MATSDKYTTVIQGYQSGLPDEVKERLEARIAELIRENEQFTYIVSHDLQAPLRTITGFLELIEKRYGDKLDDNGKQFIDFALKGSQKMKTMVMDLLEVSRLNTTEFEFEQTELMEILTEVNEDMAGVIRETGMQVDYTDLPAVYGNRKLLFLLFRHLIDNAVKFRGDVSPRVMVTAETIPGYTMVRVTDNGMGIDPAFLEKVFIIFRKLNSNEQRFPGSGKGLAICKKIASVHGWDIAAAAALGNGIEITLKIKNSIINS